MKLDDKARHDKASEAWASADLRLVKRPGPALPRDWSFP